MTQSDNIIEAVFSQIEKDTMTPEEAAEASIERIFGQRARSAAWLGQQTFPPLEWIIPGVLPEGLGMIAAAPKIGKSWFVCDLSLACAQGTTALGAINVDQRPVLYFGLEDSNRRLKSRFEHLNGDTPLPEFLLTITDVHSLTELIVLAEHFQDRYSQMAPPLIIVDTLGKVSPGRSASQSQYEADYQTGSRLQNLAKRVPGSAVLVVHHTNKGDHKDFLNAVSGTQGVSGAYDSILVLDRDRKSDEGVLAVTGRDIENETEYGIISDSGKWRLIGNSLYNAEQAVEEIRTEKQTSNFGDLKKNVLDLVNTLTEGDSTSPAEIALKLNIDNRLAGNYLRQLEKSGLIGKSGHGRYSPMKPMKPMKSQVIDLKTRQTISLPTDETDETT